ncbi:MAG: glutamine--fructose-6-phosphate transaminase (isomerizing) [Coriobacteriia bacterium]|nr:glutamine--fructose-6-phosphate transaminase (isomerizing) [Coriobacteriia bacterium]
MCGIVAFCGVKNAITPLLTGLARLEYRGYDSAGLAVIDPQAKQLRTIQRVRQEGRGMVEVLREAAAEAGLGDDSQGITCGIGHTRWATHGAPSVANAHPHCDCQGRIAVAHNGIIENHGRLREQLTAEGHTFHSQTDSEVVSHLVEKHYALQNGDLAAAVRAAVAELSGSFALAILHRDYPEALVVTRNDSPLVIGSCATGAIAASDVPALIEYTRDVCYLDDRDIAILHANGSVEYFDPAGEPYTPNTYHIDWNIKEAEKGGYPDFMLKEINEQPRVVRDVLKGRLNTQAKTLELPELAMTPDELAAIDRVYIVACGTSYHAGLIGKDLIESWARIPVEVRVASEFRYANPIISSNTLVIAITQSGETADTLEAVRLARRAGAHVVAITNVIGSRITTEAQTTIYIKANIEISVAATKTFLAQLCLLALLALFLSQERGLVNETQIVTAFEALQRLPQQIEAVLADTTSIDAAAEVCADATTVLFIGRGVGATTCYEGALKLKEISYIHAEAIAAGEIKHGTLALIDPIVATPVVAVAVASATHDKMLANIEEVKARGARVIALATEGDERVGELADIVIYLPPTYEQLSPVLASVALQLLAHRAAVLLGRDIDKPRNLAKSVTVE